MKTFTIVIKEKTEGWHGEVLLGVARDTLVEVDAGSIWQVWDTCVEAVDDEL